MANNSLKGDGVIAFEPAAMNYFILTKNIEINQFSNCIAYCFALSDCLDVDLLYMMSAITGKGGNTVGDPIDDSLKRFQPVFQQGVVNFTGDGLISKYCIPRPDYIKIDVDGLETKVLNGLQGVLSQAKGLSIEIHPKRPDKEELVRFIKECGLHLDRIVGHAQNYIFYR